MKWMRERDLLIAQTMAFVQSVTGKKPDAEIFARSEPVTPTRLPDVEAMLAEAVAVSEPPKPAAPARPATSSEYRDDIRARVEKFRANQAKFNRDREAYCSATMAKVQATLEKYPVPRPK
jgi:cytochrome c556